MKKGFTLIETMATIAVFALAMGIVSGTIIFAYRAYGHAREQSLAASEARKAMETMVQEIRKAKSAEDGSYLLGEADDDEIIFYSDIDKDGDVERVRYFLQTGEPVSLLKKGVIQPYTDAYGVVSYPPAQEEITNLSSFVRNDPPIFRYFDMNNQEIAQVGDRILQTTLVQVYLVINVNPDKPSEDFGLSSAAQVRNLKEE